MTAVEAVQATEMPEAVAAWAAQRRVKHENDNAYAKQGERRTADLVRLDAAREVLLMRQAEWADAMMQSASAGRPPVEVDALRELVEEYCGEAHEWTTADWPHCNPSDDRDQPRECDGGDKWCQTCCDGAEAADTARAQAVLSVRAALVGNYATALAHARKAETIERASSGAGATWGNLPECCGVLLEIVAEQRVAVAAKGLASAERDVMTGLECISLYGRHAREAIDDLSRAVDEEGAHAAIKSAAWNVEEVREYVATMGRDLERLREAWLAHHRAEGAE